MTDRTPAIIGFLIAGALILIVGFLAGNRTGAPDGAPALRVLAPATGDTVGNPVILVFATPAPLSPGTAGWMAGDLHLHVMIDGVEHMPAAADIAAGTASFTWRLPPLQPGTRSLHLTWAGRHHGNLTGPTDTVVIVVR